MMREFSNESICVLKQRGRNKKATLRWLLYSAEQLAQCELQFT